MTRNSTRESTWSYSNTHKRQKESIKYIFVSSTICERKQAGLAPERPGNASPGSRHRRADSRAHAPAFIHLWAGTQGYCEMPHVPGPRVRTPRNPVRIVMKSVVTDAISDAVDNWQL